MTHNMKEGLKLLAFVAVVALLCFASSIIPGVPVLETVSTVATNLTVFAVVLSFLVGIHEWGHYHWFKKAGVVVEEFAIGMGKPIIASFKRKNGEVWSFRLLLVGGYVKPQGGETADGEPQPGDCMAATPAGRLKAILAGPLVNIVFAFIALTAALMLPTNNHLEFVVEDGSVESVLGIETGNEITAINDVEVKTADDYRAVMATVEDTIMISYISSDGERLVYADFGFDKTNPGFGVQQVRSGGPGFGPVKAVTTAGEAVVMAAPRLFVAIKDMIANASADEPEAETPQGDAAETSDGEEPVGLAGPNKFGGILIEQMSGGLFFSLIMLANLSLVLGISNLIPLLPLDGGHVVSTLAEMAGKPIPTGVQNAISLIIAIPLMVATFIWLFWDIIEMFI